MIVSCLNSVSSALLILTWSCPQSPAVAYMPMQSFWGLPFVSCDGFSLHGCYPQCGCYPQWPLWLMWLLSPLQLLSTVASTHTDFCHTVAIPIWLLSAMASAHTVSIPIQLLSVIALFCQQLLVMGIDVPPSRLALRLE
jgi:hypothetical protein